MGRAFYRVVRNAIPTADDFLSAQEEGLELRDENLRREWAEGISVYDNFEYAMRRARSAGPRLGSFVITIVVPDNGSVEVRQTGANRRHHTIFTKGGSALALVQGPAVAVLGKEFRNG